MKYFRIYGALLCLGFGFMAGTGRSCSDDRGSGLGAVAGTRAGGAGGTGGSFRTYHK